MWRGWNVLWHHTGLVHGLVGDGSREWWLTTCLCTRGIVCVCIWAWSRSLVSVMGVEQLTLLVLVVPDLMAGVVVDYGFLPHCWMEQRATDRFFCFRLNSMRSSTCIPHGSNCVNYETPIPPANRILRTGGIRRASPGSRKTV